MGTADTMPSTPAPSAASSRPVTWPDVAMAWTRELPAMGVIALVAVMAMKGNVNGIESILGFAVAMLGRSKPLETSSLTRGGVALIMLLFLRLKGWLA